MGINSVRTHSLPLFSPPKHRRLKEVFFRRKTGTKMLRLSIAMINPTQKKKVTPTPDSLRTTDNNYQPLSCYSILV
jgi:hypothetical protein